MLSTMVQATIHDLLSGIPGIIAAAMLDDTVYVIVEEHSSLLNAMVLDAENKVSKTYPETTITFKVRAAQGRDPEKVAPVPSEMLFSKKLT